MRVKNIKDIILGDDKLRLYDNNEIMKVYVIGSELGDEYRFLCVDTLRQEVVCSFTEETFNRFHFIKEKDFNIRNEVLKCMTNIRLEYPNQELSFGYGGSYIEIYRSYSLDNGDCAVHCELTIDNLSDDDFMVVREIESKYIKTSQKLGIWTITVVSKSLETRSPKHDGDMYMIECYTIESVKETLQDLKDKKQDMEYVTVFPPNSGFLGTNFII